MPSVANFLTERISNSGIQHVFGCVDKLSDPFFKSFGDKLEGICTTDENHAGIAADAYARVKGVGCACVSGQDGALKIASAIACANMERSPVVVVGCMSEGTSQVGFFENITCAQASLLSPNTAGYEIDHAIEAMQYHKQPIYIEIFPKVAVKPIAYDVYKQGTPQAPPTNTEHLQEALSEVRDMLLNAQKPVIWAGVLIARHGLGTALEKFITKSQIPVVTTPLSKSAISEMHPMSVGVYMKNATAKHVRNVVEQSDCVLVLGSVDGLDLINNKNLIVASAGQIRVKGHRYDDVGFADFMDSLLKLEVPTKEVPKSSRLRQPFVAQEGPITAQRFFEKVNSVLNPDVAVIADCGDSLFGAIDLLTDHYHFLCPACYHSSGFAIPGALGAQLAQPEVRPLVLVGDGSFQKSCNELGTISELKLSPIVLILNNRSHASCRLWSKDGVPEIAEWDYHNIVSMIPNSQGHLVQTEKDLEDVMTMALKDGGLHIINVIMGGDKP